MLGAKSSKAIPICYMFFRRAWATSLQALLILAQNRNNNTVAHYSYPAMGLCKFCSSLPLKLFSYLRDQQCTLNHQPSLPALQASGQAGCDLCKLFLHAIHKQKEIGDHDRAWGPCSETGSVTVASTKFDFQHVQIDYKDAGDFRGKVMPPDWCDPHSSSPGLASDQEMRVIRYWLEHCQNKHPECANSDPHFVPTRLVDVGVTAEQDPRLVLSADIQSTDRRYLALSHCWGSTMPSSATTTLSTLAERLQSIPIVGLSRTFADFIGIARRMQVRYVWIDSLCILQDSKEDWEKEAAQMASVYSGAYCTVAASSSANGNEGCQVDPESKPYGPVDLSFNEKDEKGNPVVQKIRVYSKFGIPPSEIIQTDPLSQRGWTFQERELSNRILHYSKDSIRWECRSLQASLEFPWLDNHAFKGDGRIFDTGKITPRTGIHQTDVKQRAKDQEVWFEAVLGYTARALTKRSDLLQAFSGMARAVQSRTHDHYIAGLWRSNLIYCLCWKSNWSPAKGGIFKPQDPAPILHSRQPEYLAPSWSWACINGQISYEWWIFHSLNPTPTPRAASFIPRIIEATTLPAGLDDFGSCRDGWIRLIGKARPAFTRGEGFARQNVEGVYNNVEVIDGKMVQVEATEIGMIIYDIPSEAPLGQIRVIVCLCMLPRAERWGDAVGLALVPAGGKDRYRRVGLVSAIKLSWYENMVEGEIVIV